MTIGSGLEGPRRTGLIVLALLGFSSMAGGCSWLFTQPLPKQYPIYDIPPCSTNPVPPVLDTLFALTNTASVIYVIDKDGATNKGAAVPLGVSVAALWALSAVYGYRHTSECEDAHAGRWTRSSYPTGSARPAGPRIYPPPAPRPAEAAAQAPVAPAQPPAPAAPPAPQQQDEDEPSLYRPGRPRTIEPRPAARRLGQ